MLKKYLENNERAQDVLSTAYTVVLDLVYAIGLNMFIVPAGIYSGGLMGVCQLIRTLLTEYAGLRSASISRECSIISSISRSSSSRGSG